MPYTSPPTDALTPAVGELLPLKLCVASGPDFGRELQLGARSYRVGKAPDCDLVLTDRAVSSTHLLVEPTPHGVRVTDTGSTNGTFYRGARVTAVVLQVQAVLRVGRTELRLQLADAPTEKLPPSEAESFGGLRGTSLPMRELFARLERIARTNADVLIQGETGTGKELCARALHQQGERRAGPFEVCDLAAMSASLCESELFGHVKGAFTGAVGDRAGVFERAAGGTVFLDEVAEMPLELQPRLLRVLEAREVKRLGADELIPVDVRVVTATHRRLTEEVDAGRFRKDLHFRLAAMTVELPPLRDRPEDVPMLVDEFVKELGKPPSHISTHTRGLLCDYAWPGNVRELRNVVARVVSLGGGELLPRSQTAVPREAEQELRFKEAKEELIDAFEREYLERLLKRFDNNVTHAASAAGITRVYLQKLMKKHGLREPG